MYELNAADMRTLRDTALASQGGTCTCGQGETHLGMLLELRLDWIDGNPSNCDIANIKTVCPNCFTQGIRARAVISDNQAAWDVKHQQYLDSLA